AGIAVSFGGGGPTRTGPDGHGSTTSWSLWWCGWRGRTRAGVRKDPGRAAHTRPPRGRLDDPSDPSAPPDPAGTVAAHRHRLAAVPAHPGDQHARGGLLPRRLRGH